MVYGKEKKNMSNEEFWCRTHLTYRPKSERSPDARYCQACYDFLTKEAEMLDSKRRPDWIPDPVKYPVSNALQELRNCDKAGKGTIMGDGVCHTPELTDYIKKLSRGGLGCRKIAAMLQNEKNVVISYRTAARILSKGK
jgi:hypothetical protein